METAGWAFSHHHSFSFVKELSQNAGKDAFSVNRINRIGPNPAVQDLFSAHENYDHKNRVLLLSSQGALEFVRNAFSRSMSVMLQQEHRWDNRRFAAIGIKKKTAFDQQVWVASRRRKRACVWVDINGVSCHNPWAGEPPLLNRIEI